MLQQLVNTVTTVLLKLEPENASQPTKSQSTLML